MGSVPRAVFGLSRSHFPNEWLQADDEVYRTIKAASARFKLDNTEWEGGRGVTAEELAALAGVSRKSVMNLLSPKASGPFRTTPDGNIHAESAQRWLSSCADFRPSIWHFQEGMQLRRPNQEALIDGEPVFVSVAGDKTWFSPNQMDGGVFHVANGEQNDAFEDYWEALKFLSQAASPKWRTADEFGTWRTKTTRGWDRKARREIQNLIELRGGDVNSSR